MKKMGWSKIGIVLLSLLLLVGCSKKRNEDQGEEPEPIADNTKPEELLVSLADEIIIPRYLKFKTKIDLLAFKSESFAQQPTDTGLVSLRKSWQEAYIEWQKVSCLNFGPADLHVMTSFFNIYPANSSAIETNIVTGAANLDMTSTYTQQGFPALDYLLNGQGTDIETLKKYTTDSNAVKRCSYLKLLTNRMKTIIGYVYNDWTGSYRNKFVTNTGVGLGSSFSIIINSFVFHYESTLRSGKISIPSDAFGRVGNIYPQGIEAYFKKDLSKTLAATANQASWDFFVGKSEKTGTQGPSLRSYLDQIGAKDSKTGNRLSVMVNNQFKIIQDQLTILPNNLEQQLLSDKQKFIEIHASMTTLVRLLKADMTSAMSIVITYNDTDGD